MNSIPFLGYGAGLRRSHFNEILSSQQFPDWVEIISENYMEYGGKPRQILQHLREKKIPIVAHGVGLSLGSLDPFNTDYIRALKELIAEYDIPWFSDHLCFSSSNRHQYHDLLPILKTAETLEQIADKIKWVEDCFQLPFAIENISYYGESTKHTMSELDFLNELLVKTSSYLLFDINNVYVNSKNLGHDPEEYIKNINHERIIQVHLAGHWDRGDVVIDTHGAPVPGPVWDLYAKFLKLRGKPVSTLIEWDNELPSYDVLLQEVDKAKELATNVLGEHHVGQ